MTLGNLSRDQKKEVLLYEINLYIMSINSLMDQVRNIERKMLDMKRRIIEMEEINSREKSSDSVTAQHTNG